MIGASFDKAREEGRGEGQHLAKITTAVRLLGMMDNEQLSEIVDLSIDEIKLLRASQV